MKRPSKPDSDGPCHPQILPIGRDEVERSLRAAALDAKPRTTLELEKCNATRHDAISILADYYEQHGQSSRAALWREQLVDLKKRPADRQHALLEEIPDLLTRPYGPKTFDHRRSQMVWLLRKQGVSVRKVGTAFGLSPTRVEQIVALEDRHINAHAKDEQLWPTLKATERLLAVGALGGDRPTRRGRQEPWFDLCELPPDDWPAEHKRRGK